MNLHKLVILLCTILFFAACNRAPQTKEAYLEEYGQFMEELEESYAEFDAKDWEKQDAAYELYATEYYEQFSDEMTIGERLRVKGYSIAYNALKQKDDWEALGDFIEELGNKGEKAINQFLEDVGDDTEEVGDLLERVGNIVGDKLERIADEVGEELEDSEDVIQRFAKKAGEAVEDFVEDIEEDVEELEEKLKKN